MYDFVELFAPHLTRERIHQVEQALSVEEREALFLGLDLPIL